MFLWLPITLCDGFLVEQNVKAPGWKTGSTSYEMYRLQQQQHSSKQWAVDLGVYIYICIDLWYELNIQKLQ